jgi:hypothetical protein
VTPCSFTGSTGSLNPPVRIFGGSGSFTFAGSAVCVSGGAPVIGTLMAAGTYQSTSCGTGVWKGSATLPDGRTRSFSIVFHAFTGAIFFPDESNPANASGTAELIPTGPDLNACFAVATIVGAFAI